MDCPICGFKIDPRPFGDSKIAAIAIAITECAFLSAHSPNPQ